MLSKIRTALSIPLELKNAAKKERTKVSAVAVVESKSEATLATSCRRISERHEP
jgi:hypothetical protein